MMYRELTSYQFAIVRRRHCIAKCDLLNREAPIITNVNPFKFGQGQTTVATS